MVFEFKLPDVGEGIHEGEIVEWRVAEGDTVDADQDIVDVMTDKATVQISAPVAGTIQEIVYEEGEVVNVGEVFVLITPDDAADSTMATAEGPDAEQGTPSEASTEAPAEEPEPASARSSGGTNGGVVTTRTPQGVLAPPSVRLEARKRGIDIAEVEGSGPAGRVTVDDLDAHGEAEDPSPPARRETGAVQETMSFEAPSVDRSDARSVEPMSGFATGTRAGAHRATTLQPHFTHAVTVDADGLHEALTESRERADEEDLSLAPVGAVAKALAQALGDHPRLNGLVDEREDELVIREAVHVGVAWPTESGHEIRTVADADERGLLEIARVIAEGGEDVEPTVTVATLDDEDAFVSTPVLSHPQVTGLVVGSVDERAVLDAGEIRAGREMTLSFVFDHRWIDGYDGALLAEDVRELLVRPEAMLLG